MNAGWKLWSPQNPRLFYTPFVCFVLCHMRERPLEVCVGLNQRPRWFLAAPGGSWHFLSPLVVPASLLLLLLILCLLLLFSLSFSSASSSSSSYSFSSSSSPRFSPSQRANDGEHTRDLPYAPTPRWSPSPAWPRCRGLRKPWRQILHSRSIDRCLQIGRKGLRQQWPLHRAATGHCAH